MKRHSSTARRRSVVTHIRDPMRVFPNRDVQLFRHMINKNREEMNVLDENVCVLHPNNSRALELPVLEVKVQLSAALILSLVGPIDHFAPLAIERNWDHGPFRERFRPEAVDHVGNLLLHALAVVSLRSTSLGHLPRIVILLGVVPTHVFLGVVVQCSGREQLGFDQRMFRRNVENDTDEVPNHKLATLHGTEVFHELVTYTGRDAKRSRESPPRVFERTGFVISRKRSYMSRAVANDGYEMFRFLDGAHLALTLSLKTSAVVNPDDDGGEVVVPPGMLVATSTAKGRRSVRILHKGSRQSNIDKPGRVLHCFTVFESLSPTQ